MSIKFEATALSRTEASADGQTLELRLLDAAGRKRTLTLTAELAQSLAQVMAEFAEAAPRSGVRPTKLPKSFAVGAGQYDSVVLLRFEQEAPYALPAKDAFELAKALLNQSERVAVRPIATLQ
jgi:hypothetical protein